MQARTAWLGWTAALTACTPLGTAAERGDAGMTLDQTVPSVDVPTDVGLTAPDNLRVTDAPSNTGDGAMDAMDAMDDAMDAMDAMDGPSDGGSPETGVGDTGMGGDAALGTDAPDGGVGGDAADGDATGADVPLVCPAGSDRRPCPDGHCCGGVCVSNNAAATCGTACTPCALPNATAACPAGRCTVGVCAAGHADCDGDPSTGCETPLGTTTDCARCADRCAAGQFCGAGVCVVDPPPPRPLAPLTTARVTTAQPTLRWSLAGGTDTARVEVCTTRRCDAIERTYTVAGDHVTVGAALSRGVHYWRLHGRAGAREGMGVSPVWQFSVGARSAAVEASWGATADLNGDGDDDVVTSVPATSDISSGMVQVRAGFSAGVTTGPTTTLPASSTGVDVDYFGSGLAACDVNGDGFADLIVGGHTAPLYSVFVYPGGGAGVAPMASSRIQDPLGYYYFFNPVCAGDVNGDGYADLLVTSQSGAALDVFQGSATGISTRASTVLTPPGAGIPMGGTGGVTSVGARIGDLDADGYADVAFGVPYAAMGTGRVFIYRGSATGLPAMPLALDAPDGAGSRFGTAVAGAGDVNGDGYADLIVGASHAAPRARGNAGGRAYIYLGSPFGLGTAPVYTLQPPDTMTFAMGFTVAGVGDVNGDGYDDVAVASLYNSSGDPGLENDAPGQVQIYLGGASGVPLTASLTLAAPTVVTPVGSAPDDFGYAIGSPADINADGYADLVVSAPNVMGATGQVYIYLGSPSGPASTPSLTLTGPPMSGGFGDSFLVQRPRSRTEQRSVPGRAGT